MPAQEKAAGMLATSTTAHITHCTANSTAQKTGNPSLDGADHDRALSALHAISPDLPHDEWVRVLMAGNSAGLEYEDVDAWSAAGATYSAQAMRGTWQSIKPDGGIGAGTLFYIAAQHGWHDRITGAASAKPMQAAPRASNPHVPRESPDDVWSRCEPATYRHPYIVEKDAHGVPLDDLRVLPVGDPLHIMGESMVGALVMAVRRADGVLMTLQLVPPPEMVERLKARAISGKLNLPGFRLKDGWFTVPAQRPGDTLIYVCEGIGAAWSAWKAKGSMSVATCGAGRLLKVATELRQNYPHAALVLVADVGKEKECDAIACAVGARVARMPEGEPSNFDANDYAQRESHDALGELLENAREPVGIGAEPPPGDRVCLIRGDSVKLEPVRWLWRNFLPESMLAILGGAPGCGKTTCALSWAAIITRGGMWPDGTRCENPGDVIVWSGEDPASVIAARLKAAGADMQRVHFVGDRSDGEAFDPGEDMAALEAKLNQLNAPPKLLVLDPIVSAVTGDSHKGAEVRRGLQPVVDLARRVGCAVLGITHFSKGTVGRDPLERILGSIAFVALARVVLVAAKVKPKLGGAAGEPRRLLVRAKSNIGPDDGGFAYELERVSVAPEVEGQRVQWLEPIEGTARELLADAEADLEAEADDGGRQSAVNVAAEFLRQALAAGSTPTKTVEAEAKAAGVSMASVRRAADVLGIKKTKGRDAWYWSLSQDAQIGPDKKVERLEQVERHALGLPRQASQDAQREQDAQASQVEAVEHLAQTPVLDDAETFW